MNFPAAEPQGLAILTRHELEGQDAHSNQIAPMNPLEGFGDYRTHAQQLRTFGGPITRGTRTILLAGNNKQRHVLPAIPLRGFEDSGLLTIRQVHRESALNARHE